MKPIHTLCLLASLTIAALLVLSSCAKSNQMVEIQTPYGTMKAILYDDTPRHRDNFIHLAQNGKYDSLLFHRVVRGFIIQGGDPDSRHTYPSDRLGKNSIGDPIDAEILYPTHFHKRGALCAARASDATNPLRKSSGSQFYIVQGSRQTNAAIDEAIVIHNNQRRQQIYHDILKFYNDSLQLLQSQGKAQELSDLQISIIERVEQVLNERGPFDVPDDIRQLYTTEGGLPQLDGDYTVFGEVIDGLDIIDSIAFAPLTNLTMRPANDIWMVVRLVD